MSLRSVVLTPKTTSKIYFIFLFTKYATFVIISNMEYKTVQSNKRNKIHQGHSWLFGRFVFQPGGFFLLERTGSTSAFSAGLFISLYMPRSVVLYPPFVANLSQSCLQLISQQNAIALLSFLKYQFNIDIERRCKNETNNGFLVKRLLACC